MQLSRTLTACFVPNELKLVVAAVVSHCSGNFREIGTCPIFTPEP